MTETALVPRPGSVHARKLVELIDDLRCDTFGDPDDGDHRHCLYMAASWPDPAPYCDLDAE